MSDLVFARNCIVARMLPETPSWRRNEHVCQGGGQSVKLSERSDGPDTALYKNYLYIYLRKYERECKNAPTINHKIIHAYTQTLSHMHMYTYTI